jgi:ankyrin repeat domain-containing protein 50
MKTLALNCLMWIFYAKRPLRTNELQHALALATDSTCQMQTDIDVDKIEVILEACGNLLVEENYSIRPVHYSVQEFFTNPPSKLPQRHIQESLADLEYVHSRLTNVCLRYIQLGMLSKPCESEFDLYNRVRAAQFAPYTAHWFDYHLSCCRNIPRDTLQLVDGLLHQGGDFFAALLQIRNLQDESDIDTVLRNFDQVSFAVSARTIIYGTRLFEIDYFRTLLADLPPPEHALHQASSTGSVDAVKRLIEQGCDVNAGDGKNASPMYYASLKGHDKIVELLLSKGANINAQGGQYDNALQAASFRGYDKIIELLLSKGADINAQGGQYGNALQAASFRGYDKIIELLLSKGADINAQGGSYGNALQAASYGGHDKTIELLLSKGAVSTHKEVDNGYEAVIYM